MRNEMPPPVQRRQSNIAVLKSLQAALGSRSIPSSIPEYNGQEAALLIIEDMLPPYIVQTDGAYFQWFNPASGQRQYMDANDPGGCVLRLMDVRSGLA